jgi:phospholipid/cholesterol/gamma-HCH transport system substrate-binding protein
MAWAALAIATAAIVVVLLSGGTTYVLHAEFSDAGQLVKGDLVTVAGHSVGSVGGISLSPDGLADVELDISDSSITPIRADSIATIGQLSLTGVANRFVGLTPGEGAPIPSGGTLPVSQTHGIVDLDSVLDALTPRVRDSLQQILKTGGYLVGRPTSSDLNELAAYLNPALSQTAQLTAEIASNRYALDQLVSSAAEVSTALAAGSPQLGSAVTSTARTFREVASERSALEDAISRAPAVLDQGTGVLRDTNYTLKVLNPVLGELQPVAPRLASLLRVVVPVARNAIPTIADVQALIPGADEALQELPRVVGEATPAVRSLTAALGPVMPILEGFRAYVPEVVAGFFEGFGGSEGGYYDANGHYIRVQPVLSGTATGLHGALTLLGDLSGTFGPLKGQRTGLLARCPGGGSPPATAGGNPWTDPDTGPDICNPADDSK